MLPCEVTFLVAFCQPNNRCFGSGSNKNRWDLQTTASGISHDCHTLTQRVQQSDFSQSMPCVHACFEVQLGCIPTRRMEQLALIQTTGRSVCHLKTSATTRNAPTSPRWQVCVVLEGSLELRSKHAGVAFQAGTCSVGEARLSAASKLDVWPACPACTYLRQTLSCSNSRRSVYLLRVLLYEARRPVMHNSAYPCSARA